MKAENEMESDYDDLLLSQHKGKKMHYQITLK